MRSGCSDAPGTTEGLIVKAKEAKGIRALYALLDSRLAGCCGASEAADTVRLALACLDTEAGARCCPHSGLQVPAGEGRIGCRRCSR